ncbi:MAG: PQQ-binding-like beta-propeller repeat protein [Verrucomicrobiales bacterium]|nr:PQQ-binding-like beta-propeller repeat protein [Verrucomicrobiales bacterium]
MAANAIGGDWPMWRYDAGRSAASPDALPPTLHLHWERDYGSRRQVWDDPLNHDLMPYDRVFEPVVLGSRLFLAFNDTDQVVALDTRSGQELWRFTADGPIRLPPAGSGERLYVASDDGFLYCLRTRDGAVEWKFRGGPSARKAVGNDRLISAWPARGGPVVRDGVVYFASSIWPFMGTFIHALDTGDGSVRWVNDGTGADFIKQPHSAFSFAGVAPQGALVATAEVLLAPGGRSVPAAFDRATGALLHFEINAGGKGNGGSFVAANDREFFTHTRQRGVRAFDLKTGKKSSFICNEPVLAGEVLYTAAPGGEAGEAVTAAENAALAADYEVACAVADWEESLISGNAAAERKAQTELQAARRLQATAIQRLEAAYAQAGANRSADLIRCVGPDREVRWSVAADGSGDLIQAGNHLYAAGGGAITAVRLPEGGNAAGIVASWPVNGEVLRLVAADNRLFAVTLEGRLLAFGDGERPVVRIGNPEPRLAVAPGAERRAQTLIERADAQMGYALCYGADDVPLLKALVAGSALQVIVVEPDADRVTRLRDQLSADRIYGQRITVHQGMPLEFLAPPYFARLVLVGASLVPALTARETLEAVYSCVRPYGGLLWVGGDAGLREEAAGVLAESGLPRARFLANDSGVGLVREGQLPGAADWTHLYGNIANTVKSDDRSVRLPLGLLWFGGSSNMDVLPRHGHGPAEQVIGGRLYIQGMKSLSARDVYTGQPLWQTAVPDLDTFGVYYDESYTNTPLSTIYNQGHIPGANARGANFVATEEAVYLAVGGECRVYSPATGVEQRRIAMPSDPRRAGEAAWGFIGVYEDLLIGGSDFARYNQRYGLDRGTARPPVVDLSASAGLTVFNRHTGAVLWQAPARYGFVHNGIVAGGGRIYCLDRLPESIEAKLERRGRAVPDDYRIVAFEARTGGRLWEHTEQVFGTWLAYGADDDILLQAGARARDRLLDEVGQGMGAHSGADGTVLWFDAEREYTGPCILHNDVIITTPGSNRASSGAYDLRTGAPHLIPDPLTGVLHPWRIYRTYGCNTPVASENLLTFRSGAAGFYDLECRSGTGNFGGFKSGCTANLIIADGVLNAPDYTRTCTCAYQNQTSLGLVPMPEAEVWTYNLFDAAATKGERILRLGLNLGAPGDRRSADGTLWLDYPPLGGSNAPVVVRLTGNTDYFRRHPTQVQDPALPWVTASGVEGIESLSVGMVSGGGKAATDGHQGARTYTVRLHFSEPRELAPGDRVFTVSLQGRDVLPDFDVCRAAGGPARVVTREFAGVVVGDWLELKFRSTEGSRRPPLLCGLEVVAGNERGDGLADATP